jgi:hypothetical protein
MQKSLGTRLYTYLKYGTKGDYGGISLSLPSTSRIEHSYISKLGYYSGAAPSSWRAFHALNAYRIWHH